MGKWYDTGFKDATDGLPLDPPMHPGHRSFQDYQDGYKDGVTQLDHDARKVLTLDDARDAFREDPSPYTAERYAQESTSYHDDGIISDKTHDMIMDEVRPHLEGAKPR